MDPLEVEERLGRWLGIATSWDAILLLDEADVYLESRVTQDLQRNMLVSIFLRELEYYQGILFLTTNRVGSFDEGFVSRIHVIIHYPDFTDNQRKQIWENFFQKLETERENIRVTQRTIDYATDSSDMRGLNWNGREIRNGMCSYHIDNTLRKRRCANSVLHSFQHRRRSGGVRERHG